MKKNLLIVFLLLTSAVLSAQLLSQVGKEDDGALELIKGQWIIQGRQFVFEYTDHFACKVDGLKYYHYNRSRQRERYPLIYTIVKLKKTKRLYFARGRYQDGRFYGTTSRIVFRGKNHFTVYSSTDSKKIYFKATRVEVKTGKGKRKTDDG